MHDCLEMRNRPNPSHLGARRTAGKLVCVICMYVVYNASASRGDTAGHWIFLRTVRRGAARRGTERNGATRRVPAKHNTRSVIPRVYQQPAARAYLRENIARPSLAAGLHADLSGYYIIRARSRAGLAMPETFVVRIMYSPKFTKVRRR